MSKPTEMRAILQKTAQAMENEIERHCLCQGVNGSSKQASAVWLRECFPAWKLREWDRAIHEADRAARAH